MSRLSKNLKIELDPKKNIIKYLLTDKHLTQGDIIFILMKTQLIFPVCVCFFV